MRDSICNLLLFLLSVLLDIYLLLNCHSKELDCELQIAYKDKISANDRVYGPFFELKPGENTISIFGNYTELEIVYQKMYI